MHCWTWCNISIVEPCFYLWRAALSQNTYFLFTLFITNQTKNNECNFILYAIIVFFCCWLAAWGWSYIGITWQLKGMDCASKHSSSQYLEVLMMLGWMGAVMVFGMMCMGVGAHVINSPDVYIQELRRSLVLERDQYNYNTTIQPFCQLRSILTKVL